jgi:hypothetical protein
MCCVGINVNLLSLIVFGFRDAEHCQHRNYYVPYLFASNKETDICIGKSGWPHHLIAHVLAGTGPFFVGKHYICCKVRNTFVQTQTHSLDCHY